MDDHQLLASVLEQWQQSHRLEEEHKQLQDRLVSIKTRDEVVVPAYKRWTGTGFVQEKPVLRHDGTVAHRVCMCAGAAAVICARVLGVIDPALCGPIDLSHVFGNRQEALVHLRMAEERQSPCARMDLIEWETLTQQIAGFAMDKTSALQRLRDELESLISGLEQRQSATVL